MIEWLIDNWEDLPNEAQGEILAPAILAVLLAIILGIWKLWSAIVSRSDIALFIDVRVLGPVARFFNRVGRVLRFWFVRLGRFSNCVIFYMSIGTVGPARRVSLSRATLLAALSASVLGATYFALCVELNRQCLFSSYMKLCGFAVAIAILYSFLAGGFKHLLRNLCVVCTGVIAICCLIGVFSYIGLSYEYMVKSVFDKLNSRPY